VSETIDIDGSEKLSAPETKAGRLQRACLALLREHEGAGTIPTNGRFVFYELTQRGVIPKAYYRPDRSKAARQPKDDLSRALMHLREIGVIPSDWIEDETREVADWHCAGTVKDYLLESLPRARIDPWGREWAPLTICESRATKGVLERIAREYLAPITATNGQAGGFLVTDVAPLLQDDDREVLYIGDLELRGPAEQIEDNTRGYLERHTGRQFEIGVDWTRIALTQEQVDADPWLLGLTIDKTDKRYKPPKPYQAVECEAVGQARLEEIFRAALDERLPEPLDRVLAREQRQRAAGCRLLNGGGR
jgi:hypothetical protein